jgi:hypothetical protein
MEKARLAGAPNPEPISIENWADLLIAGKLLQATPSFLGSCSVTKTSLTPEFSSCQIGGCAPQRLLERAKAARHLRLPAINPIHSIRIYA